MNSKNNLGVKVFLIINFNHFSYYSPFLLLLLFLLLVFFFLFINFRTLSPVLRSTDVLTSECIVPISDTGRKFDFHTTVHH